jgi:hypothetical protein
MVSGWEKAPGYGGGDPSGWTDFFAVLIIMLMAAGVVAWGLQS